MNLRETALGAEDRKPVKVDVPEWGITLYVRAMGGDERDHLEISSMTDRKNGTLLSNIRAKLLVLTVCDENGELVFSRDDVEALGKKSAKALNRLYAVASVLNDFTKADINDLKKNSKTMSGLVSNSDLQPSNVEALPKCSPTPLQTS